MCFLSFVVDMNLKMTCGIMWRPCTTAGSVSILVSVHFCFAVRPLFTNVSVQEEGLTSIFLSQRKLSNYFLTRNTYRRNLFMFPVVHSLTIRNLIYLADMSLWNYIISTKT